MDFNPPPAGGPDGALAWYNQSLAKVLGLNPADPTLPADMLSELSTAAQRKALGTVINRRFRRRVDEVTGAVTMEKSGDAFAIIEPDEDSDPEMALLTTTYLGAAQAAVASIDPNQALPGRSAAEVSGLVQQIQSTIAAIVAEAPVRSNRFQMILHLDELIHDQDGLIGTLSKMFEANYDGPAASVGLERAIKSAGLARRMLETFKTVIEKRPEGSQPSLSEIADVVASCGAHVSTHARNVRTALRAAGIGSCELRAVEIQFSLFEACEEPVNTVTLDEGLQTLETEPKRWPVLIASGLGSGFDHVERSATRLKPMVEAFDSAAILKRLGILAEGDTQSGAREAFALSLSYQLDRLRGYTLSVLKMILREVPVHARLEAAIEQEGNAMREPASQKAKEGKPKDLQDDNR